MRSRGLSPDKVHDARFAPSYYKRPAVVFALRDEKGKLIGLNGRRLDNYGVTTLTVGRVGIYVTSPDVFESAVVAICEAPIDALTIWQASAIPAVALCGTRLPEWLPRKLSGKHVFVATDSDKAGNNAAVMLVRRLEPLSVRCVRLNFTPAKDANELGTQVLGERLKLAVNGAGNLDGMAVSVTPADIGRVGRGRTMNL